jgi:hypothetical protein
MTFYDIIDSLIDLSKVDKDKQKGDGYEAAPQWSGQKRPTVVRSKAARREIHDNLTTIEDVTAACYHEAGHLIYANLIGFKYAVNTAGFRILGPQIEYHEATNIKPARYEGTPTAICCPGLHVKIPDTNPGLLDTAMISVAGGEAVGYFSAKNNKSMWKRGTYDDQERFKRFATDVRNRVGRPIEPYITHWQDATTNVRKDFASDLYVSDIETEALCAMMLVFRPVFLNTKDSQ